MVTLSTIPHALVAADPNAAERFSALNYDEFQNDQEIAAILECYPDSILGITMPHMGRPDEPLFEEGSQEAL